MCAGRTALHLAVAAGHADVVQILCTASDIVDVNALDASSHTALHAAAASGHVAILERLLATPSVDPLCANDAAGSPVKVACAAGGNVAAVPVLQRLVQEWQSTAETRAQLRPWFGWSSAGEGHALVRVAEPVLLPVQSSHTAQMLTSPAVHLHG